VVVVLLVSLCPLVVLIFNCGDYRRQAAGLDSFRQSKPILSPYCFLKLDSMLSGVANEEAIDREEVGLALFWLQWQCWYT
jgi:hypothetical protein